MLSLLPQLFSFQIIAFALLRLTVAVVGFLAGWSRYHKPSKWVSVLYFAFAVFLLLGLYTQVVALLSIILAVWDYYADKKISAPSADKKLLYVVTIIVLLSLVFTGPGFLGIDKPL